MAYLAVWQRTIVDEEGNVVPGAEIEVRREEDGSLATLYADRAGETPLANPLAADMSGFVRFFVQGGAYTITAVGAGSTRTWRFDPTGRLQEFDRVSEALVADDAADLLSARSTLGTFSTVADVQNSHIPPVLDSIRTNGYYAPGDGGGALYRRVASEPSHEAKIQSADGAWWELYLEGPAHLEMFGDTSGDCAPLFTKALEFLKGRELKLVSGKRYTVASSVSYAGDVTITCDGEAEIFQDGQDFRTLDFKGSFVAETLLAGPKEIGTCIWDVADASQVDAGMLMEVVSSKSWYYDPRPESTDARKSELHKVVRVDGNLVHTEIPANDGYPSDETVAVRFYAPIRVNMRNVVVRAVHDAYGPSAKRTRGLTITYGMDCVIENTRIIDHSSSALLLEGCYNCRFVGGEMSGVNGAGSSYAFKTNGCTLCQSIGTHFARNYAGADFSGANVISLLCSVRDTTVTGGGLNSNGEMMGWGEHGQLGRTQRGHGCHGPSDRCSFVNNRLSNLHNYIVARGRNHVISRNIIEGRARNGAIRIYDGYNFVVSDNICDPSFFGGKDTSTYAGANINSRLPNVFLQVLPTYVMDGDGPLVVQGNKVLVRDAVIDFTDEERTSGITVKYSDNSVRFRPISASVTVGIFSSAASQVVSGQSSISVGNPRSFSGNTTVKLFNGPFTLSQGVCIFDYSYEVENPELFGTFRWDNASLIRLRVVFDGAYATGYVSVGGGTITADPGEPYSVRFKPPFLAEGPSSNTFVVGTCSSLSSPGEVSYLQSSHVVLMTFQATGDDSTSARGVFQYPIGGTEAGD